MPLTHLRRPLTRAAVLLAAALAVVGLSACGGSDITRARLERSLPQTFANLYVQQAKLLGHQGITVRSLHPRASCDKGGPKKPDTGPGADWICQMSWQDPNVPLPDGFGKFELNVHSNDCYTAGGPSKLTGFLTITDKHGKNVTNPLFEFDGCFDPKTENTATGVYFPSLLAVTSPNLTSDASGRAGVSVTCGTGAQGCAGTVVATAGRVNLGSMPFKLKEEATGTLRLPKPIPTGTKEVTFTVQSTTGVGPPGPSTIPVQGS